ncbi:alginate O-acetyltransferase AlgX-related protein [Puniceicoccus vermicola]|uniref:AlgX/AlgJ SGNH hydrolase-like domain-containing protein n=1 Tax=Puniceicoccus vermicola TaxID=388746 RepID=A0A7X1E3J6_9BACT|nr:hypothetical protein [Puniceicoccus vermicola]MBC2601131.1 hypothetical protein [Puniceicoccus vermicola]
MDREKEAWEELERSSVSCGSRWLLVGVFLFAVFAVFVVDLWHPYGPRDAVRTFSERSRPLETDTGSFDKIRSWNREVLTDIEGFEAQIEDESVLARTIPFYQWFMVRALSTSGTGRVLIGRDDWYFLKEGLETTLGWGAEENLKKADAAVRRLAGQLAQKGISLILVPIPGKADLYPGQFSSRFTTDGVLAPAQRRERFYRNWASLPGVDVLPARELLTRLREKGQPVFLERDTHWTPAAMETVARALADSIQEEVADIESGGEPVSSPGDLVEMMRLPVALTPEQQVEVERISTEISSTRESGVIFLGDSFAAVFSDAVLGWGENAGLQDRLPALLGESFDFRLNYGDPVSGPGRQLERLLNSMGEDSRPRVVIWEFAERFLDEGEWDGLFR